MLCCVPKRPANGGPFHDEVPSRSPSVRKIELYSEEDAPLSILLPCAICARTFMPQSLEKHARICERTAAKKRKPFDSAKQRIRGTDLAEFLPKQETRRHQDEKGNVNRPSWKKNHDDFLRVIRKARGEVMDPSKQYNSPISSGAPTRANEKGTCPTCNRHFGIKAYDRHVAWCKERIAQMPMSPATNLAKERLNARMRYRAPTLKSRRAVTREKYSPGSAMNLGSKTASSALAKPKESISTPNRESLMKLKPAIVRRPTQLKESSISSGVTKPRLAERVNKPAEKRSSLPRLCEPAPCFEASSRRPLHLSVPFSKHKINDSVSSNAIVSPDKKLFEQNETVPQSDEPRNRETRSARIQRNIVSARSQGHPKINDIAVNDKTLGVTVQPCKIYKDAQRDGQLITWKQISRKKSCLQAVETPSVMDHNFLQEFQLLDFDERFNVEDEIDVLENKGGTKQISLTAKNEITRVDELKINEDGKISDNDIVWLDDIQNPTYLITELEEIEESEIFRNKWKPIRHSPRVEFYFKNTRRDEICEVDIKRLKENARVNDEEIKKLPEREEKELKINDEENIRKRSGNRSKIAKLKTEKLKTYNDENDNHDNRRIDDKIEVAKYGIKEIKLNNENIQNVQKTNDADVVELDELTVNNKDEKIDENIAGNVECNTKVIEAFQKIKNLSDDITQNLSDRNEDIEPSTNNKAHSIASDALMNYEKSSKELKMNSADNDKFPSNGKSFYSECKDLTFHFDNKNNLDNFVDFANSEDETSLVENNKCCDDLVKLNESTATFVSDRCDIDRHNLILLNNCSDEADYKLDSEHERVPCRENTPCNSLDLQENVKKSSSLFTSCQIVSLEENIMRDAKEIEQDEEKYENCIVSFQPEMFEEDSNKLLNSEISLSQKSQMDTNNHFNAHTNNILSQVEASKLHEKNLDSLENNSDNEKTDFIVIDLDNNLNKAEVTASNDSREACEKSVHNDVDCDNDYVIVEDDTQNDNDVESSITLMDNGNDAESSITLKESQRHGEMSFLNANISFPKSASDSTGAMSERPVNTAEMKHKIRESMNLLRSSTDSLISSVEFVELASIRRSRAGRGYEREIIEIIRPRRRKVFEGLPDIKSESAETREDSETPADQTYWQRASKISQSKLIGLDSLCPTEYRLFKKNPRICILPPVPSSPLTNRSGMSKDYDPFLLAEQQMNDLLSDTSDQSVTDSSKSQTRDGFYPLSHSSAFVKYPQTNPIDPDKRTSLIAPPSEFDDLASDFSTDSIETNSISREIFLGDLDANKDTKSITSPSGSMRPVRELGRRLIIDKSRALGGGTNPIVADKSRPDKIAPKIASKLTRSLIDRSNSTRASSAPRTISSSDRKISSDSRKPAAKLAESRRLSDQNLNQRNNNYSSLSGSNLSLSSIVSSEIDIKRSNSMFDELMTSLEEDIAFPNLKSFLDNESFDLSSSMHDGRQRNGLVSDEELSSPDSYKLPQDHSKLSNDSAYSSLNRKYSHHGCSANDMAGRLDEDPSRSETLPRITKCKMSKFCHECGLRFPENAKFCCECGVRRLAL